MVALRTDARTSVRLCNVRAARRQGRYLAIILVLDAVATDARDCFHALLARVKVA
jgi:hypothetical protein